MWLTLTVPEIVIVPFEFTAMAKDRGFIKTGSIMSLRTTLLGTVLIMRSSKVVQVETKTLLEAANLDISLPPSELNIRESERVVTLLPMTRGFCVVLSANSIALATEISRQTGSKTSC